MIRFVDTDVVHFYQPSSLMKPVILAFPYFSGLHHEETFSALDVPLQALGFSRDCRKAPQLSRLRCGSLGQVSRWTRAERNLWQASSVWALCACADSALPWRRSYHRAASASSSATDETREKMRDGGGGAPDGEKTGSAWMPAEGWMAFLATSAKRGRQAAVHNNDLKKKNQERERGKK